MTIDEIRELMDKINNPLTIIQLTATISVVKDGLSIADKRVIDKQIKKIAEYLQGLKPTK